MPDLIQQDLQAWFARRDREAFRRAYECLQHEACVVLRPLEPWLNPDGLRQRAQEVVNTLLFPAVPAGVSTAATKLQPALRAEGAAHAYRAKVFYSFIVDEHRARLRHQELDKGATDSITATAIREARRRRREQRAEGETVRPKSERPLAAVPPSSVRMQIEEDAVDRIAVRRALARMSNVRNRAIVALEFGFDPAPFLDALARWLGRDASVLAAELASFVPNDGAALIRIFHPLPEPLSRARENFGRARRRALKELQSALQEERGA